MIMGTVSGGDTIDWVREEQPMEEDSDNRQPAPDGFLGKLRFHCEGCGFLVVPHEKLKARNERHPNQRNEADSGDCLFLQIGRPRSAAPITGVGLLQSNAGHRPIVPCDTPEMMPKTQVDREFN
jgi:hypothetical protein